MFVKTIWTKGKRSKKKPHKFYAKGWVNSLQPMWPLVYNFSNKYQIFLVFIDDYNKKIIHFFLDGQKWHLWKIQNFKVLLKMEKITLKCWKLIGVESFYRTNSTPIVNKMAYWNKCHIKMVWWNIWKNKTILEKVKNMAMETNCPNYLWTKVVNTTTCLTNKSPTNSYRWNMCNKKSYPFELLLHETRCPILSQFDQSWGSIHK
jgi:hypothetical protein